MAKSFSFSAAWAQHSAAERERKLAEGAELVFDGSDGDTRGTGRSAWVRNEERAKQLHAEEGRYEGIDRANEKTYRDGRGRPVTLKQDVHLIPDGQEITVFGERATVFKQEAEIKGGKPTGDVLAYVQMESGGMRIIRGHKVADGRHRIEVSRKRFFSF